MKVNDDLYIIPLPMSWGGQVRTLNLSLIVDLEKGAYLVDTGLPNQEGEIEAQLKENGFSWDDVNGVLLTHQDVDHVGSLQAAKDASGSEASALDIEIPYIDGRQTPVKYPSPERIAENPGIKAMFDGLKKAQIENPLTDGQLLPIAGGVKVVATPGHTPGHASFYLVRSKTLIAGDALISEGGQLQGVNIPATPDMDSARASVKKMAELDVETIICYHGGLVTDDANGQLKRTAETL